MSLKSEKPSQSKLFDPFDKIPDFEIDDVTRKRLCFKENLIVSLNGESPSDTKPLGGYCVSIESIGPEGSEFLIQVISSLSVKNSYAGSKVLSSTTAKFHCLEEKRREYIHREDGLHEKTLFIGLEDDFYHLDGQNLCPCEKNQWQKDLPLSSNREIISEGANVLLMRYLALKNFHGSLSFQSVMIGGQLTTCNYRCSEARKVKFNGHTVEAYTIERRMLEECGLVHNVKTLMTQGGNILRHDWLEIPYVLEINPILDPNNIDHKKPTILPPLRSRWDNDIQMMSLYLDKKTHKIAQQSDYLADHPEIKQLISDYAQTLLAVKPINVLPFTIQHFAAFAKYPDPSGLDMPAESNLEVTSHKARRICSICGICFDCLMPEQPPLNSEGDHGAPSSPHPPPGTETSDFSLCSVFTKCPSDASCVKKSSGGSGMSVTCSEDCKACKIEGKTKSFCSFSPECEKTCDGCTKALKKPCDILGFSPECEKTCDGCTKALKKPCDVPGFSPECEETCDGCVKALKKPCSVPGFSPDCEKTCDGCTKVLKNLCDVPSLNLECEKTCEGCVKPLKKPCDVHKACPECPGCHEVCSELRICPNCKKCNIEILPESAINECGKRRAGSGRND